MAGARVLQTWCKEELRAVIRYEWANGLSPSKIHTKLVAVYGDSVMSVQIVRRWCNLFAEGRVDIFDAARSCCPSTASSAETIAEVNELIQENRRIKLRDVVRMLDISIGTAHKIIHEDLGYRKVCARW